MQLNEFLKFLLKKNNIMIRTFSRHMGFDEKKFASRLRYRHREQFYTDTLKHLDYKIIAVPITRELKEDEYDIFC